MHTGGIEMGQGLHTKIAQVAAAKLGISVAEIRIAEVSTDSLPNTSATAGSTGADLNAAAAIDACRVLMARLAPVREHLGPNATMAEVASEARARRIPLQATGHHSSDVGGFDWQTGQGIRWDGMMPAESPTESVHATTAAGADVTVQGSAASSTESRIQADLADYFAVGVSCVEVSLDVMTGEHVITRADVLVDAGESLNPALDIGQVEGAFMQGVGYHTTEEIEVGSSTSHQCVTTSADSCILLPSGLPHSLGPV
jgi:xanthine dehydrogenase molybdopterin-binding subunit B